MSEKIYRACDGPTCKQEMGKPYIKVTLTIAYLGGDITKTVFSEALKPYLTGENKLKVPDRDFHTTDCLAAWFTYLGENIKEQPKTAEVKDLT